ncbi:MAG: alpha/beta fold hydrolase [Bdellovibrionota bacterium]
MKRIVGILIGVMLFGSFASLSQAGEFKDCSSFIEECIAQYSPYSSFYINSPQNTKAVVLVHGLTDSPYFTKDLALLLNQNGYNVYSVLLSGHGTKVEELFEITSQQWLMDIEQAILFALKNSRVKKVALSGFSMGGVLISSLAQDPYWKNKISTLILMAPAFKIKKNLGIVMCASGAYRLKTWAANSPEKSPIRYNQMPFYSVCELTDLSAIVRKNAKSISTPVFMVVTDGDQTINTQAAIETLRDMSSNDKKLFYIKNLKTSHTDLVFRNDPLAKKKNPQFDQMGQRIIQFLK